MIIVCIFALFPFVWMISTSFKPAQEVYSSTPSFIPKNPTANGYEEMLTTKSTTFDFMQWTVNSVIVSLLTTLFSMVIATLGGYGISRFRFRGRNALSYIILTTQVLPGSLLIIPLYIIMGNMQLLDTRMGLVMAYATFSVPFCTWMMKGFFDSIPVSLEEAAKVDGCPEYRIFIQIVLPLIKPVLVSLVVFTFVTSWNDFLWPLVATSDSSMYTLTVALSLLKTQYQTNYGLILAGATISFIFPFIMYIFLQKQFVEGVALSGIKG